VFFAHSGGGVGPYWSKIRPRRCRRTWTATTWRMRPPKTCPGA